MSAVTPTHEDVDHVEKEDEPKVSQHCVLESAVDCFEREQREIALNNANHPYEFEIEEIADHAQLLSPLEHFFPTRTLSVTQISGQTWCEQQTAFNLTRPRRQTAAMKQGIKRHEELELELHEIMPVAVESLADRWALHLLNTRFCIRELINKGCTRELRVFGALDELGSRDGIWMGSSIYCIGIIDHIEIRDGHCCIVDTKTRSVPRLPGIAQKRGSRLQLMLYNFLLGNMITSQQQSHFQTTTTTDSLTNDIDADNKKKWFHFLVGQGLDPTTKEFSAPVQQLLIAWNLFGASLNEIMTTTLDAFSKLPPCSDKLRVEYEMQGSKSSLGTDKFEYSYRWLKHDVSYFLEFWRGIREPDVVQVGESWKCALCDHREVCSKCPALAKASNATANSNLIS